MTAQIPKDWHQCCTCEKWAGQRKLDFSRSLVETESATEQGECIGGPWNRIQTYANHQCEGWSKWWQIQ